jgi:hypothetical protein
MTAPAPEEDERRTRPFADIFNSLRRGKTHREAGNLLQELVREVQATGRQGSMTIRLKVSRNKSGMVEIDDTLTTVLPKPDRDSSLYFADDDGNLTKDDPRQPEIPGIRIAGTDQERAAR